MRKRQFRYILPFLILALFVFATVLNSQEPTEESTEKPKQTEQSQPEKITEETETAEQSQHEKTTEKTETAEQPQDEEITEETEVTKPTPENSIPSESQPDTTTDYIENLQSSSDTSNNSFQYFLLIIAFIILNTVFVIFFLRHIVRKQQKILGVKQDDLETKLDNSHVSLESLLEKIKEQGEDGNTKLVELASEQTLMNDIQKEYNDTITSIDNRFNNIDNTLEELKIDRETLIASDSSEVNEMDAETTVLQTQERIEELELAYKNGEPIDLDKIDTTTQSQNKVLDLNWIARALSEWITELEQSDEENNDLIQSLKYAMHAIKGKLKTIREESPLALKPSNIETDLEIDDIRSQSIAYPAQLEGILLGCEISRQFDEEEMNRFIKQFVKDSLFNNVAKYIPHDKLQEQLDRFLILADFEVIPVEVGATEVNSQYHDIQDSKQTEVKRGTVAEVISPGLMQKADNFIVQKPVVIRGE